MRRLIPLLSVPLLAVAFTACSDVTDPVAAPVLPGDILFSSQPKVDVCHVNGQGDYHKITIAEAAYPTHVAHGDATPGEPVPGTDGALVFGPNCEALSLRLQVTGSGPWARPNYEGTFDVDASMTLPDGSGVTGSAAITAVSQTLPGFDVSGNVACLAVNGDRTRATVGVDILAGTHDNGASSAVGLGIILIVEDDGATGRLSNSRFFSAAEVGAGLPCNAYLDASTFPAYPNLTGASVSITAGP